MAGGEEAANIRVVTAQPDARALEANGESAMMLLYLNKDTWLEEGDVLERDVRAARSAGTGRRSRPHSLGTGPPTPGEFVPSQSEGPLKIVMVHENDARKGGCEFGIFFTTVRRSRRVTARTPCPVLDVWLRCAAQTPAALIDEALFSDIAIALHTPPHRSISLGLVAQAFGATKKSSLDKVSRRLSSSISGRTLVAKVVKRAPTAAVLKQPEVASSSTDQASTV